MIEPLVDWLRTVEGLPFDANELADHLFAQQILVVQDSDSLRQFSGFWKDRVPDGTVVIATFESPKWVVTAMVDARVAGLPPFLHSQLGYVPKHMLLQFSVEHGEAIEFRTICATLGKIDELESFDDAAVNGVQVFGKSFRPEDREVLKTAHELFGVWKFQGLEAMRRRNLIGFKFDYSQPRYRVGKTLFREETHGVH